MGAKHQGQLPKDPSFGGTLARRPQAAPGGAAGDRVGACGRLRAEKPGGRGPSPWRGLRNPPKGGRRRRGGPRRAGGRGALPGAARPVSCAVGPSVRPQALPEATSEWPRRREGAGRGARGRVRATKPRGLRSRTRGAGAGRGAPGLRGLLWKAPVLPTQSQASLPDTGNGGCRGRGP